MAVVATSEIEQQSSVEWPAAPSRAALAWRDLTTGWSKSWLWGALALQDIRLRYRGSMLGPFWLTLSTLIMVAALGTIYPLLFRVEAGAYIPYLAVGLVVWQLLSNLTTEGCDTFVKEESVIQQVPIPFSVHAYRCVCRNFIVLGHNLAIVPLGMVLFQMPLTWRLLEIIPAFALLALNGLWISILLGMTSTRFRDVPPIVANFLQVLFFLTPVMWPIDQLGDLRPIATWNPFFAAIDVVRAPLLGVPTAEHSWALLLVMTVVGGTAGFVLFARFRTRIAYWV